MRHLKNNSLVLLLCFFISGCQSASVYNHKTFHTNADDLHVIFVNSDRVQQKCLFFDAEAENNWRHQYLMHILSDRNEVLEVMQSTNQDKDTCEKQVNAIEKILRFEPQIKLCVRGELKTSPQDSKSQNRPIRFGGLGDHKIAYEPITLDSACNSKRCVSNNNVWVNTCPGFVKH
jgi:hypothetical protein